MSRRFRNSLSAAAIVVLALPASAAGEIVEVGDLAAKHAPSCPASPCQAVSRTTAYQAKVGEARGLFVIPKDGRIVAWSITLGAPGRKQIDFFDRSLGGPAAAGITVLKPGGRLFHRVTGQSPIEPLSDYFGQTVQFPLASSLEVRKGQVVALTVPTWAPALALGLGNDSSWRASRRGDECADTEGQSAQTRVGGLTRYRCLYKTARLTYSATLITRPARAAPAT